MAEKTYNARPLVKKEFIPEKGNIGEKEVAFKKMVPWEEKVVNSKVWRMLENILTTDAPPSSFYRVLFEDEYGNVYNKIRFSTWYADDATDDSELGVYLTKMGSSGTEELWFQVNYDSVKYTTKWYLSNRKIIFTTDLIITDFLNWLPNVAVQEGRENEFTFKENFDLKGYNVTGLSHNAGGALKIPDTWNNWPVKQISADAFYNKTGLTSITLPKELVNIKSYAFGKSGTNIGDISLPKTLKLIDNYAFQNFKLSKVVYEGTLNEWLDIEFGTNPGLFKETDLYFQGSLNNPAKNLLIEKDVKKYSFYNCRNVQTLELFCKEIGQDAFRACSNLTSIKFDSSLVSIGAGAFQQCTNLKTIERDNQYRALSIGNYAFYYCPLTNVSDVFWEQIEDIGYQSFYAASAEKMTFSDNLKSVGQLAFAQNKKLTEINLLDSKVSQLPSGVFSYCSALEIIKLPGTLVYNEENKTYPIGTNCWLSCGSLKEIWYKNNIENWKKTTQTTNTLYGGSGDLTIVCTDGHLIANVNSNNKITDYTQGGYYICKERPNKTGYSITGRPVWSEAKTIVLPDYKERTRNYKLTVTKGVWDSSFDGITTTVTIDREKTGENYQVTLYWCMCTPKRGLVLNEKIVTGSKQLTFDDTTNTCTFNLNSSTLGTGWLTDDYIGYSLTEDGAIQQARYEAQYGTLIDYASGPFNFEYSTLSPEPIAELSGYAGLENLESIQVSAEVQNIARDTFDDCPCLYSIEYKNTVDNWRTATSENKVWNENTGTQLKDGEVFQVNCLDGFINIDNEPAYKIPFTYKQNTSGTYSVTGIKGIWGYTTYTIPNVVDSAPIQEIADNAFSDYNLDESVAFNIQSDSAITHIGANAFPIDVVSNITKESDTTYLQSNNNNYFALLCVNTEETKLTINSNTKIIAGEAISGQNSLRNVTIPLSVRGIGSRVFDNTSDLLQIQYLGTKTQWENIDKKTDWYGTNDSLKITCGDGTTIDVYGNRTKAYQEYEEIDGGLRLKSYRDPDNRPLTEVTLVAGSDKPIIEIGANVFKDNTTIKTIIIPSTVKQINAYAFFNCSSLINVKINSENESGTALTDILDYAFAGCDSLKGFVLPDETSWDFQGIKNIGSNAFNYCRGLEVDIKITGSAKFASRSFYLSKIQSLIQDDTELVEIGEWAFASSSLTEVQLLNCSLGEGAFRNCQSLTLANLPYTTTLPPYTFYNNTELEEFTGELVDVGDYAFEYCKSLTNISTNLDYVGVGAFANCGIEKVTFNNPIYVNDSAFQGCKGLTFINIPASVERIGSLAFSFCSNITDVVVRGNTRIVSNAFMDLTSLQRLWFDGDAVLEANAIPIVAEGVTILCNGTTNNFDLNAFAGGSGSLRYCFTNEMEDADGWGPHLNFPWGANIHENSYSSDTYNISPEQSGDGYLYDYGLSYDISPQCFANSGSWESNYQFFEIDDNFFTAAKMDVSGGTKTLSLIPAGEKEYQEFITVHPDDYFELFVKYGKMEDNTSSRQKIKITVSVEKVVSENLKIVLWWYFLPHEFQIQDIPPVYGRQEVTIQKGTNQASFYAEQLQQNIFGNDSIGFGPSLKEAKEMAETGQLLPEVAEGILPFGTYLGNLPRVTFWPNSGYYTDAKNEPYLAEYLLYGHKEEEE